MNDAQPPKKKQKWIPIVLGILFLFVVLAVGGVVFVVSFMRQNVDIASMSEASADDEFAKQRERFAGRKPLIEMVDGRPQYLGDRATGAASSTVPLKTMHVMAWDDDEGKLVRFSLPFWLLRLKSGPIQLSAYSQGWDDRGVSFRVEDLEKHGPGLLMDLSEPTEGRVMIWVE
jgi:hypothetical protein